VSLTEDGFIADVRHFTGVPIPADPVLRKTDDYVNADVANVSDARIEEVVSAALRLGTAHTPAVINEEVRRSLAGFERHPADPQLRVLPDFWTPIWHLIWLAPNRGEKERIYEGFLDRERALLRALFAAGAPVYAGTDTLMPFVAPGAALEGRGAQLRRARAHARAGSRHHDQRPGSFLGGAAEAQECWADRARPADCTRA
jgi:hypothetical protein